MDVEVPDRDLFHNYENPKELALSFRNHTLYYTIPKDMKKENHYLVSLNTNYKKISHGN